MDLQIKFSNEAQKAFYYSTARNQCFSGGFNNGKSYGACLKALTLLTTFPGYRIVIARQTHADLLKTTYQTFFKICPQELIARRNEQDGLTELYNGSRIIWMHLDKVDESTLRGLETNGVLIDQAEEIEEKVYDVLDARIGRWDEAKVPTQLLEHYKSAYGKEWPINEKTGKYIVPSYHMLLCNPDTQYHFIYRKYHPDSLDRRPDYFYVEGEWDQGLGSAETYAEALRHDDEWVSKYIKGQWGISNAQIHRLWPSSIIEATPELLGRIATKANKFRVLDHGESSPTCCGWFASLGGVDIGYREYYVPGKVISEHRQAINDMSVDLLNNSSRESYGSDWADPSIFHKESQRQGGFWSVADEYMTNDIPGPPIVWLPADNNEFATRNRINERLKPSPHFRHPITGESPAPGIYFIKRTTDYPQGCYHMINQMGSQRRKLIGYFEGKALYADDREESVEDHAYDVVRYYIAMHAVGRMEAPRQIPRNSFKYYKMIKDKVKFRTAKPLSAA